MTVDQEMIGKDHRNRNDKARMFCYLKYEASPDNSRRKKVSKDGFDIYSKSGPANL